jgi:uncharacterized protein YwqG
MAQGQDQVAAGCKPGSSMTDQYLKNAQAMRHSAHLAGLDGIRVPRRVLASRAHRIALGFHPASTHTGGEAPLGVLKLLDASTGKACGEWISKRFPIDGPGRGVERFFNTQLAHPLALSAAGTRVLIRDDFAKRGSVVECSLDVELTKVAEAMFGHGKVVATNDGWITLHDDAAERFGAGLNLREKVALPRGVLAWAASTSHDGNALLLPTMSAADFWLVSWDGTKPRRFSAHRGARRDAMPELAVSDSGRWVASRCDRDVVLTRVGDGISWIVTTLEDATYEDLSHAGYVVRSFVPAGLGFIGERLLVCDAAGVREIALEEGHAKAFVSEQGRPGARKPIKAKPAMSFEELMKAARLDALAPALREFHSPAVSIKSKALGKTGWLTPDKSQAPGIGASRFGGWPDLPEGAQWPTWSGRPMAFLAQLDLADLAEVEPAVRLPATGLLSFFLGCGNDTYEKYDDLTRTRYMIDVMVGTEPSQDPGWLVLYTPKGTKLSRIAYTSSPLPELTEPHTIGFTKGGLSLPDEQTAIYAHLPLDDTQRDNYNELVAQLKPEVERFGEQVMGYPSLIQSTPPELMCELAATGRSPWSLPPAGNNAEEAELASDASEWTLLLQLTSNGVFEWGDAGHFYFYGDRRALERGDFSKTWVNFEN